MGYTLQKKPIADLDLDPKNPRLPNYVSRDQEAMLQFLANASSIEELMSAISENDFFQAEALIAVPEGGRLVVVEGNRRLTALKLLSGANFEGMSSRIHDFQQGAKHKPTEVPVAVYDTRDEVLNYLGNRHIAGVKPWGALAKARYIRQLFDATDRQASFQGRARTVAKVIGSRRDFISKAMRAYDMYSVAEEKDFFGIAGIDEKSVKFSLLSTAVDYEGVQAFVYGAPDTDEGSIERAPDPDRVKELFQWMFSQDKDGKTPLGESRNIIKLSRIMMNEEALKSLRTGATVEQAYLLTTGVGEDFDALCIQVQRELREANSIVADVENTETREELVSSIFRQARQLEAAMRT
ncbi:hypothetical protein VW23_017940 [Devosia insulae DS-56]|uniref:ParB/Sulfiredoxin domain-containing protein n=1 Tax=Devosia insulae DS-56 TaxID=1116389 RepID=A0A1E5XR59_9HYPH|nr:ParB-like nuclease domain-containing protein [Devosia insulae]OEO31091.1 hypothetical protein VW23_017940 [Devosia insulae DS-56]